MSICYLRGTHILTPGGEVAVETLAPGDLVETRFGARRPVRWIGKQCFDGKFLGRAGAPVRIRAGALGQDLPHRDLFVSPYHSIVVEDYLVMAKLLVNGITVTQEAMSGRVDYFHIDLGMHDCVRAEGAWAESYAEKDNRNSFHNAAEFAALFPDHRPRRQETCLPLVGDGHPKVPALRAAVVAHIPAAAYVTPVPRPA